MYDGSYIARLNMSTIFDLNGIPFSANATRAFKKVVLYLIKERIN